MWSVGPGQPRSEDLLVALARWRASRHDDASEDAGHEEVWHLLLVPLPILAVLLSAGVVIARGACVDDDATDRSGRMAVPSEFDARALTVDEQDHEVGRIEVTDRLPVVGDANVSGGARSLCSSTDGACRARRTPRTRRSRDTS